MLIFAMLILCTNTSNMQNLSYKDLFSKTERVNVNKDLYDFDIEFFRYDQRSPFTGSSTKCQAKQFKELELSTG